MSVLNDIYHGKIHWEEDYKPELKAVIDGRRKFAANCDRLLIKSMMKTCVQS